MRQTTTPSDHVTSSTLYKRVKLCNVFLYVLCIYIYFIVMFQYYVHSYGILKHDIGRRKSCSIHIWPV